MGKVVVGLSTSVDGVASGESEADFWPVHEAVLGWLFGLRSWRAAQGMDGGEDDADSRLWAEDNARIGAQVVGRRMFDFAVDAWGEDPPFHVPVFVVTHRAHERVEKAGGTSYTFVTGGVADAVAQAAAAAGGRDVLIAGGLGVARQALAAGLVDELSMHIAPVVLGHGARLLDGVGGLRLRPRGVAGSTAVTHVRYDVLPTGRADADPEEQPS